MPGSVNWFIHIFGSWADKLPCDKVIFIAGNHDIVCERKQAFMRGSFSKDKKATYLHNDRYDYISNDGKVISIFGSPYCKIFGNWAFMRDPETLERKFSEIPEGLDILLTHDAPYGVSDIILDPTPWNKGDHIGNPQLREAVLRAKPKYLLHGHLHSTSHCCEMLEDTEVYNVSIKNEAYEVAYRPLILDI